MLVFLLLPPFYLSCSIRAKRSENKAHCNDNISSAAALICSQKRETQADLEESS